MKHEKTYLQTFIYIYIYIKIIKEFFQIKTPNFKKFNKNHLDIGVI